MIRALFDFLLIITVAVLILGLLAEGYISMGLAVFFLIVLVFFISVLGASRAVRLVFRICLPLVAVGLFIIRYGGQGSSDVGPTLVSILTLLLVLFGFYTMFRGFRRK